MEIYTSIDDASSSLFLLANQKRVFGTTFFLAGMNKWHITAIGRTLVSEMFSCVASDSYRAALQNHTPRKQ